MAFLWTKPQLGKRERSPVKSAFEKHFVLCVCINVYMQITLTSATGSLLVTIVRMVAATAAASVVLTLEETDEVTCMFFVKKAVVIHRGE